MLWERNKYLCVKVSAMHNEPNKLRQTLKCIYHNQDVKLKVFEEGGCKSQQLMLACGLIYPGPPGTYTLLPLAARSMDKLVKIIDSEMRKIGAEKINMPSLGSKKMWDASGRWQLIGEELLQLRDRHGSDFCLSPTHEEAVTSILASNRIVSYKLLPVKLYQITRKYRDEARPKHGLLRGREFEMKDLYTFDMDENLAKETYDSVCDAYEGILDMLGLKYLKVEGSAGTMGGSTSHEYHLPCSIGEDVLSLCKQCGRNFNQEIQEEDKEKCEKSDCNKVFINKNGIEVMHAFLLGNRYSKIFHANYIDRQRNVSPLCMGCFGLGVTRLLAAGIEVLSCENQIRWPRLLSPFSVCIIPQKEGYRSDETTSISEILYDELNKLPALYGEVILDDRIKLSIGRRIKHAQQLGFPYIIAVGKSALEDVPKFEVLDVYKNQTEFCTKEKLIDRLRNLETVTLYI